MGAAPPEVEPLEVEPLEVEPLDVEPLEVASPAAELLDMEPPEVEPPEVEPLEVELLEVEPPVSASARAAGTARGAAMPSNAANRPAERACLNETVCIVVVVRLRGELTGSRLMALRPR